MPILLRSPADFGAVIRDRRRALGLGQAELAQRIGVRRLWVAKMERGNPGANLGTVLKALDELGVTVSPSSQHPTAPPLDVPDIDAIVDAASRP
jgi:HTH-type transcriptional regulator / antitoxin HipB